MTTFTQGTMKAAAQPNHAGTGLDMSPAVVAVPYLTALLPVSFTAQACARACPRLGELVLSAMIAIALTFAAHLLLKRIFFRSPVTEVALFLLVAFVGLFRFVLPLLALARGFPVLLGLGVVCLLGSCVALRGVRKLRGKMLNPVASIVSFALVVLIGYQATVVAAVIVSDAVRVAQKDSTAYIQGAPAMVEVAATRGQHGSQLPDIYHIVLDGYGRSDVLQRLYGTDNSDFLENLRRRDFFVASHSRSNYHQTEASLASTLNLGYLDARQLQAFRTRVPLHSLIHNSLFVRILKQHGYETVAFQSGTSATECTGFERYLSPSKGFSNFQDFVFHMTAFPALLQTVESWVPYFPSTLHRNRIAATFQAVPEVTRDRTAPSYVFAHILAPHPPFVFDEFGNARDLRGANLLADGEFFRAAHDRATYVDGYSRQLRHINQQVLTMVDRIQTRSSRPVVIVLQGDHGPRSRVHLSSAGRSDLDEALGILLAAVVPPDTVQPLDDDMTAVNVFRAVLNCCLGSDLRMLEDRCYFEEPPFSYRFRDVTVASNWVEGTSGWTRDGVLPDGRLRPPTN